MSNPTHAPSLDEYLRLNRLSMASFDGLAVDQALQLCGLSDRVLAQMGDAHRDRSLVVRGALIDRLAQRAKAYDTPDENTVDEGDVDGPKAPKKGKKTKSKADDEEMDEPRDTTPDRHEPKVARRAQSATDDQVTAAEIATGYRGTVENIAKQVIYSGRARRGEIPTQPPAATGNAYQDEVNASAAAILAAGKRRRGEEV